MRQTSFVLLFVVLALTAHAQRPWIKVAHPNVGNTPLLATTQNSAYLFDSVVASTYTHGNQWELVHGITQQCKAVLSFVNSTTLAFSQPLSNGPVESFYTITGATWTASDTLDLNSKNLLAVSAVDDIVYLATNDGSVYSWSAKLDSAYMFANPGIVSDFVAAPQARAAITNYGLFIAGSNNKWAVNNPPSNKEILTVCTAITRHSKTLCAATDKGVFDYNADDQSWSNVGKWPVTATPLSIVALASDNSNLIAMVQTADARHQLYRFDAADSTWVLTAFDIPMDAPTMTRSALTIDAGWALTYQHSNLEPDSTGLYAYNLNDFTNVTETDNSNNVQVTATQSGLNVTSDWEGALAVDIVALDGRMLYSCEANAPFTAIALPPHVHGVLCVVVTAKSGKVARRLVMR